MSTIKCTRCSSDSYQKAGTFERGQRYKCKDCGKYFYYDNNVDKIKIKRNFEKIKLEYEINNESKEEFLEITTFSKFEDKINSLIDNFKASGDEYFDCTIYYCMNDESEELTCIEIERSDINDFNINNVDNLTFIPDLKKVYDLNYFINEEIALDTFYKRLTKEEEKKLVPKIVEIIYETEKNLITENIGTASSFKEFKILFDNCDFYKYSSSYYQGDNQDKFSVGFNFFLENSFLGSLKWHNQNKTLNEFLQDGLFEMETELEKNYDLYEIKRKSDNETLIDMILGL